MRNGVIIDAARIMRAVTRVETAKRFRRNPGLILRHLFEEVGELSRKVWLYESARKRPLRRARAALVAEELVDVVCLSAYLADVVGEDLNRVYPGRLRSVFRQYNVSGEP